MRQLAFAFALLIAARDVARAFCGFYVSRADSDLFNKASKVVLAHNGDKTVLTMASDVKGDPEEFAIVIPVPTVIQRDQIRVIEPARMDRLDAYTAPRLVEYYDEDPCLPHPLPSTLFLTSAMRNSESTRRKGDTLGVTVEATYSVGEYDIVILSARDSSGLLTWLDQNGYKVPRAAEGGRQLLSSAEPAFLSRQGEPRAAEPDRLHVSAADPDRVRVVQIHAADPARHGERRRSTRADHSRSQPARPHRNNELPHGSGAHRPRGAALCQSLVWRFLPRDV